MLPAFKGAIAAAFATEAYALVITTLWLLADAVGWARLLLLMVTAIVAMVAGSSWPTTCGSAPRTRINKSGRRSTTG